MLPCKHHVYNAAPDEKGFGVVVAQARCGGFSVDWPGTWLTLLQLDTTSFCVGSPFDRLESASGIQLYRFKHGTRRRGITHLQTFQDMTLFCAYSRQAPDRRRGRARPDEGGEPWLRE